MTIWYSIGFSDAHQKRATRIKWTIRNHECEVGIEKSVPGITDWYHEAFRVMTNGDGEGRIFLSHSHMKNGFFFLLTTKYLILYCKKT